MIATPPSQASAGGNIADGQITGRAGVVELSIGRAEDGVGIPGATPYDLLSASLAACTAMTIRAFARRNNYGLTHVDVFVSYHHLVGGGRGSFERVITLQGDLGVTEKKRLLHIADICPVSKTLEPVADIHTYENGAPRRQNAGTPADYEIDLSAFSLVNIDPD